MTRYAKTTKVPVANSHAELHRVLARYGVQTFGVLQTPDGWIVTFEVPGTHHPALPCKIVVIRDDDDMQETRRRWRVLVLQVKALLESVDAGVMRAAEAFLPFIVTPDGRTVGQRIGDDLESLAVEGHLPRLTG